VGLEDWLLLRVSLLLGLTEGVRVLLEVPVALPVPDALWLALRLSVLLPLGEMEGLAPGLREAVGKEDREALRLLLLEGVSAAVPEPLCVCVPLPVTELVEEGEMLPLGESEEVPEGLAPWDRLGVGLPLLELLQLGEVEGVTVAVPLRVADIEGVTVLDPVPLPLVLGLAPLLRVEAADGDWEALRLRELEEEPVPLPLPVGEPVLLLVPVGDAVRLLVPVGELLSLLLPLLVTLPVPLLEAVLLGLAPLVRDAVALALTVELPLSVEEGVLAALLVPELLQVPVCEGVGVEAAVLLLL